MIPCCEISMADEVRVEDAPAVAAGEDVKVEVPQTGCCEFRCCARLKALTWRHYALAVLIVLWAGSLAGVVVGCTVPKVQDWDRSYTRTVCAAVDGRAWVSRVCSTVAPVPEVQGDTLCWAKMTNVGCEIVFEEPSVRVWQPAFRALTVAMGVVFAACSCLLLGAIAVRLSRKVGRQ